jgi:hypothetical protein
MCSQELPKEKGYYFGGNEDPNCDEIYKYNGVFFENTHQYIDILPTWWLKPIEPNYVKELAWDEGFKAGCQHSDNMDYGIDTIIPNPYKQQ